MPNEQNLCPRTDGFTLEEAKKGGKRSGEVRSLRAAVRKQLAMKAPKKGFEDLHEMLDTMGVKRGDRTYADAMAAGILYKALKGDVKCAEFVRDTAGEKPTDRKEIEYGDKTCSALLGMTYGERMDLIKDLMKEFVSEENDE